MASTIIKRSVIVEGHKTSISLEDAFWSSLKEIAASQRVGISELVANIHRNRRHSNLSSAIRLFVLDHYQAKAVAQSQTAKSHAA
jgi:predicted DNA-binding ribbon-helix-helix protein